jgi:uncharacterized membrane protein
MENSKSTITTDASDIEKNKAMAVLSYIIFFLPLITDAKDSKFAKFHANQSLAILIVWIGFLFVSVPLSFIVPFFFLISFFVGFAIMILWFIGIINALSGKMSELPLIGSIHILDK